MTAPTPVEVDVRLLGPLKKIGSGGQGTVYELLDGPDTLVYKEYSARVVDDVDVAALRKFVTFARELDEPTQRRLTERAAWPVNLVRRDGVVRGFVMPRAPRDFMVELAWTTGRDTVLAQTQYLLNDRQYLRERGLTVTDRFRLEFLRDTVETIALFHRLGIVVGDLSPHNLLFSQAVRPRCFFIDCDAMRLGADSVLAAVETPDWRVEDLGDEELATRASDSYKLGLLALRIFAGDQHERDLGAVSALPARTRSVATSSLARSPAARPPVQKWLRPLDSALRQANRRPFRRRTDRPPRTASQTRQRRRWPWLAVAPVVIGIVLGIVNSGNGTGSSVGTGQFPNVPFTPVAPVTRYFPLNTLSPTIFLTPPVLIHPVPALPTCFLVDIRAVATKYQGLGIDQPLGGYACALTNDDYTSAAGPNDTRSAGNFHQLAALARGGSFTLAVTAVRQESAATLRVSTKITVAGTSGSTVGCRSTTFVLNGGTNAGYTISSVGPPLAVRCG